MAHILLSQEKLDVVLRLQAAVENWLHLEGNARSTLAGAVVLLDTIRSKAPFAETDVFTGGGQLAGGRGAALRMTLQRYGIQNPDLVKDEHAAFAGDVQTGRVGDIVVGDLVFHVVTTKSWRVTKLTLHCASKWSNAVRGRVCCASKGARRYCCDWRSGGRLVPGPGCAQPGVRRAVVGGCGLDSARSPRSSHCQNERRPCAGWACRCLAQV